MMVYDSYSIRSYKYVAIASNNSNNCSMVCIKGLRATCTLSQTKVYKINNRYTLMGLAITYSCIGITKLGSSLVVEKDNICCMDT